MSKIGTHTRNWVAILQQLPVSVPAGLAVFSASTMLLLVFGWFNTLTVWLVGSILSLCAVIYVGRLANQYGERPGNKKEQKVVDLLVVLGVLVWVGFNIPFTGQRIFTDRDPAVYSVTSIWLTKNDNLDIPRDISFGSLSDVRLGSGSGFGVSVKNPAAEVYAQGAHLLPALLASAGRLVGYHVMLHLNVVIGGVGLLALYGFARLVMRPIWASLAVVSLAFSLPYIYLSREIYTEPLTLALLFGSFSMLWYAKQKERYGMWFMAGIGLGASLLARIDAFLPLAAVEIFLLFELASAKSGERNRLLKGGAVFVLVTASLGLLGWLDLTLFSSGYYRDLHLEYISEVYLIIGLALVGGLVIFLNWKNNILKSVDAITHKWRSPLVYVLGGLFFAYLVLRPIFHPNLFSGGLKLSPEEYTPLSLYWVAWYLPVLTLLGIVSLVWLWGRIFNSKERALLLLLSVVTVESLLYFIRPSISPDQLWATRRYLPVIFPGLAVLGFFFIGRLHRSKKFVLFSTTIDPKTIATVLATLAVITPLFVSYPFMTRRNFTPQIAQIEAVCSKIPKNSTVLWFGSASSFLVEPTHTLCGVPAYGVKSLDMSQFPKALKQFAAAGEANGRQVIVGTSDNSDLVRFTANLTPVSTITWSDVEQTYKRFPRNSQHFTQTVLLGSIQKDGSIRAL